MRSLWGNRTIPNQDLFEEDIVIDYGGEGNPLQTLILHKPEKGKNLSSVLWFHGGGLTNDLRECPDSCFDGKRIILEARYRLIPEATPAMILDDAVSAAVWTFQHIAEYGGSPEKCFCGGMSAGCYLAAMIGFDRTRIDRCVPGLPAFAGLLLESGQYTTHFKIKELLHPEIPRYQPCIDEYAPLSYLSDTLPPMVLICGEPDLDIPARPEECAFAAASLKAMGHKNLEYVRLPGCNHGHCLEHGGPYLVRFMEQEEAKFR